LDGHDALEQFQVILYNIFDVIYITNNSIFATISALLVILLNLFATYNAGYKINIISNIMDEGYNLVLNFYKDTFSPKNLKYFPLVLTVFYFILSSNLIGMLPLSFSTTSQMSVAFTLGFSLFVGYSLHSVLLYYKKFLASFFPPGSPKEMAPLLVIIEIISFSIRGFSLSIRLFANLMSGHALLKILAGFAWMLAHKLSIFAVTLSIFPLILTTCINGLELGVCCLQAFIFAVLLTVYLRDSIFLH